MTIFFAVEDILSKTVIERLITDCIGENVHTQELGKTYGGNGYLRKKIANYIEVSKRIPVVVLTDLDQFECAPGLRKNWLYGKNITEPLPEYFVFCIAVREVEAWLLADRQNFANFLSISPDKIDRDIESLVADPKSYLINLVKNSRDRDIKSDILPNARSQAKVGVGYNGKLCEYVLNYWNPVIAADNCPSLQRARSRLIAIKEFLDAT